MLDPSSLRNFAQRQALYISAAAIGTAVFWAIGQQINPATVLLYGLLCGNLATPAVRLLMRRSTDWPAAYKWLLFLVGLLFLTPILYVIASVIVWRVAPPSPQSLGHLLTTGWKFPCLLIVVYGVVWFLYTQTKEGLERRNAELQSSLDRSSAQLEVQEEDLQRAREIQRSLLPKEIPQLPGFEIAAAWQPARLVGGDYFDVLKLDDNRLAICIADVVGKGVSAALLMANVQATVRAFAYASDSPSHLCGRVNRVLCGNIDAGKFVTFFYAILDARRRNLNYCNAGHPRPILLSGNAVRHLCEGGPVLGVFPHPNYQDGSVELSSGDRLLLFTDGITEAPDLDGEEFGDSNLVAIAQANHACCAQALNTAVLARVNTFCSSHFQDDATLLVLATT